MIYSTRFLTGQFITGTYAYTVPSGMRAVLKTIDVVTQDASAGQFSVQVAGSDVYAANIPAGPLTLFQWRGMAVCYAGEAIAFTATEIAAFALNGYLFQDP